MESESPGVYPHPHQLRHRQHHLALLRSAVLHTFLRLVALGQELRGHSPVQKRAQLVHSLSRPRRGGRWDDLPARPVGVHGGVPDDVHREPVGQVLADRQPVPLRLHRQAALHNADRTEDGRHAAGRDRFPLQKVHRQHQTPRDQPRRRRLQVLLPALSLSARGPTVGCRDAAGEARHDLRAHHAPARPRQPPQRILPQLFCPSPPVPCHPLAQQPAPHLHWVCGGQHLTRTTLASPQTVRCRTPHVARQRTQLSGLEPRCQLQHRVDRRVLRQVHPPLPALHPRERSGMEDS
mmetsp:Transcript_42865/g.100791  ORF Transcript_42865/g.100791 Transcript_42865/m.100791 type:complete len:293 (+) Transcript_42865:467-1345(+)